MKGLLALIVLVLIGISVNAQEVSNSVRQTISITVVDYMDVKVQKQFSKDIKSDNILSSISTSKKNTAIFTNVISGISNPEFNNVIASSNHSGAAMTTNIAQKIKQQMMVHTITAY